MRKWLIALIDGAIEPHVMMLTALVKAVDKRNQDRIDMLRADIINVMSKSVTTPTQTQPVDEEQVRELRKKQMQARFGMTDAQAEQVDWSRVL